MTDIRQFQSRVNKAVSKKSPLCIRGGGSKDFYGRRPVGEPLVVAGYRGIIQYEPDELVVTVRCGTPLVELQQALGEEGQMLGFEPPHWGGATIGGAVAAGLSGPRRPFAGAVRDFVLGVKLLSGRGEVLVFGGQVMKNVAGFDFSRVLAGSLGTLGVVLEISLKVLPRPELELTLRQEIAGQAAWMTMTELMGRSLPLTGLAYHEPFLYLRLSGVEEAVTDMAVQLGGERLAEGERFWHALREQTLPFFTEGDADLWRLTVAPAAQLPDLSGRWLLDWGGAQRWLRTHAGANEVFAAAAAAGGHATLFRTSGRRERVFQPLPPALEKLHRALKEAFDPHRIFNPGRMYSSL